MNFKSLMTGYAIILFIVSMGMLIFTGITGIGIMGPGSFLFMISLVWLLALNHINEPYKEKNMIIHRLHMYNDILCEENRKLQIIREETDFNIVIELKI